MIYIGNLVSRMPVTVTADRSVCDAAEIMRREGVGSLLVVDSEGRLAGILTERDLAYRVVASRCSCDVRVGEVMTPRERLVTVEPGTSIAEAARIMIDVGVRHLPVVTREGRLVGVVSLRDLARAIWGMHEAPSTP